MDPSHKLNPGDAIWIVGEQDDIMNFCKDNDKSLAGCENN